MECYCDTHLQNDDEYLLDDKNTQPLLQNFEINVDKQCSICKYRLPSETTIHAKPNGTKIWSNENGFTNHTEINTIIPKYTTNHRPFTPNSSRDSGDSTFLLNEIDISSPDDYKEYHCHHTTKERSQKWVFRRLLLTSILCFIFMIAELVGGYIADSLALMVDSAHMLIDVLGCFMALSAIFIGKKKPTKKYSFGYYRAELIGAFISVLFIWGLTGIFVFCAIKRVITNEYEIQSLTMLIVSIIGLIVNIFQVIILHGLCSTSNDTSNSQTDHGHGHSHNINLRAAMLHVIGDFCQSIGIVVAAIIIMFYPHLQIVDPICTFIFSIIVLFTTRTVFQDTLNALMEGFPLTLNHDQIFASLIRIPDVKHVHNLQVWTLTMGIHNLAVHLAVDKSANKEAILKKATVLLRTEYNIHHSTIQVETYNEIVMLNCQKCRVPDD